MKKFAILIFLLFAIPQFALSAAIDIMLVFDIDAQNYARRNYGGSLEAYATEIIEEANIFYANSNVNIELNCVKVHAWNYSSSGDGSVDLNNVTNSSEIASLRDECNADMVSLITNASSWGNLGGIAWLVSSSSANKSLLFSAVNRSTGSASTFVHELGHNMGLTHSPDQATEPGGNGLYPYSCGYHFTGSSGKKYHTIMAYNFDGKGGYYSPTSMFSSPEIIFDGVPMGTYEKHNSSLSLNQRRLDIARVGFDSHSAPRILEFMRNAKINSAGDTAEFTVEAENLSGISYRWQIKENENSQWSDLPHCVSKTLSFSGDEIFEKYGAKFRCVLSNAYGNKISEEVGFEFAVAPITLLSSTDFNIEVFEGQSADLFVEVKETDVKFQWQVKKGLAWFDIDGANSPEWEAKNILSKTSFRCKITRGEFEFYAPQISVSVLKNAKITSDLSSEIRAYTGNVIVFSIKASGDGLSYCWQKLSDGIWLDIEGGDGASCRIANVGLEDAGQYRCVVSNGGGFVVSNTANLQVLRSAQIDAELGDADVYSGDDAFFEVIATGDNLAYQWQLSKNMSSWTNLKGETSSVLKIENVGLKDGGIFYRCKVSNAGAAAYSNAAELIVKARAKIEKCMSFYTAKHSSLNIEALGFDLHYKWQKFEGDIWIDVGEDLNTLKLSSADWQNRVKFRCIIGNTLNFENQIITEFSAVNSSIVLDEFEKYLECYEGVKIKLAANAENLLEGSKLTFKWECDKNDGKGLKQVGTKQELDITPTLKMDGWSYKLTVSNGEDAEEAAFSLKVFEKLKITQKPKPLTVFEGLQSEAFSVSVSGHNPSYRWQMQVARVNEKGKIEWVWEDIENENSSEFYPETALDLNSAKFRLKVFNGGMEIYTSPVKYTVRESAKILGIDAVQNNNLISSENAAAEAGEGSAITLNADARGYLVKYKWYENGVEINGATQKKYVVKKPYSGMYAYTCEVYNMDKKSVATSSSKTIFLHVNPSPNPLALSGQSFAFFEGGEYMFTLAFVSNSSAKVISENDVFETGEIKSYRLYKNASASYKQKGGICNFKLGISWQDALENGETLNLSKAEKEEISGAIDFGSGEIAEFGRFEVARVIEPLNPLPISIAGAFLKLGEFEIEVLGDGKNCFVNGEKGNLSYKRISPFVATFTGRHGKNSIKDGVLAVSNGKIVFRFQDGKSRLKTGVAEIDF